MRSPGRTAIIGGCARTARHAFALLLVLACCPGTAHAGFDFSTLDPGTLVGGVSFLIFCLMLLADFPAKRRR
jgi:hypothetical protein